MIRYIIALTVCALLPVKTAMAADSIKVYAAASMTNVVSELAKNYSDHTGKKVVTVFAGSSSLARQIQNGAPADIFISANKKWVDYLVKQDVIQERNVTIIAENELVLISPNNNHQKSFNLGNATQWDQILKSGRVALGQPDSVPAGIYAKESLTNLGVWETVKLKSAPTNSVRVALALVERGEAKLGIVYKTDALLTDKVTIVDSFDDTLHDPIVYPMAVINGSDQVEGFAKFLLSKESKQVFNRYGFK